MEMAKENRESVGDNNNKPITKHNIDKTVFPMCIICNFPLCMERKKIEIRSSFNTNATSNGVGYETQTQNAPTTVILNCFHFISKRKM